MRAHAVESESINQEHLGWATTASIRSPKGKLITAKGQRLTSEMIPAIASLENRTLHLVELEPGDLHEDDAGRRVCEAVTGPGVIIDGPYHSRFNLNARHRGLLTVNEPVIDEMNRIGDLAVFTLFDNQAIVAGKTVAGVKATPIVVKEVEVEALEDLASAHDAPVIDVLPFKPLKAFVVATESLHPRLRERFQTRARRKIEWFGGSLLDTEFVDPEPDAVADAFRAGLERGADVFMAAGGNTLDPLDPIFQSLPRFGAEIVHFGAPADPGSMFWVARVGEKPIFNLASCSMYSESTVIDLMLPRAMAGLPVTKDDVISLGYGGLLEDEIAFRFPDYDADDDVSES